MTQASTPQPASTGRIPAWLPLGLVSFGALGLLRWQSLLAIDSVVLGADPARGAWNVANGLPEQLLHLAVFVMAGAALCAKSEGKRIGLVLLSALAFLGGVTGWPIAPLSFMPELALGSGLETVVPLALACLVWSFVMCGLVRMSSQKSRLLVTAVGVVIAALPFWFGMFGVEAPTIAVRDTVRQLIDDRNFASLEYTSWPPSIAAEIRASRDAKREEGEAPSDFAFTAQSFQTHAGHHLRKMITPAVYKEFDVGDKYTLVSPPGTTIEFDVAEEDGPVWLRTSVGAHKRAYDQHCPRPEKYDVRFEVLVNGEARWTDTLRISWQLHAKEREWRHAGGKSGLALEPGDHVTLRTSFASDHTPEGVSNFRAVWAGWADLVLESETTTPRLHSTPDEPNVVLIVMDTLRADRLSSYGYGRNLTPNLTRLADRGVQYDRAYSTSSWTWPSTASMLTGLYPAQHGVVSNEACTLTRESESVAEVLQHRGFTTAGFSCNPLVHQERYYDQGFEHFDAEKHFRKGDEINPLVFNWLRKQHGSRFFLYLHMADPHTPHRPHPDDLLRFAGTPPEDAPKIPADQAGQKQHEAWDWFDYYGGQIDRAWQQYVSYPQREALRKKANARRKPGDHKPAEPKPDKPQVNEIIPLEHQRWVADVYDASVASCDRYVGELLSELESLGLDDRTIVIFTADHGEELLDHGRYGHGQSLFEEVVHVPLIVAGPGIPGNLHVAEPISNRHVAPTIAWRGDGNLRAVPGPQDLFDPRSIHSELVQVQTVKGKLDGRRMFWMEGVIAGDQSWHYSRRCNPATWEVILGEDKRPFEEHLRYYDLGADPLQRQVHRQTLEGSKVIGLLLKNLEDQAKLKQGEVLPAGDAMHKALSDTGYAGNDENAQDIGPGDEGPAAVAVDDSVAQELLIQSLEDLAATSSNE